MRETRIEREDNNTMDLTITTWNCGMMATVKTEVAAVKFEMTVKTRHHIITRKKKEGG